MTDDSELDPLTSGMKLAKKPVDLVCDLARKVFMGPAEELGVYLQRTAARRLGNVQAVAETAERLIELEAVEVRELDPEFSVAVLEGSARATSEDLQEMFARLLVRAHDDETDEQLQYVRLLETMAPFDARYFRAAYWSLALPGFNNHVTGVPVPSEHRAPVVQGTRGPCPVCRRIWSATIRLQRDGIFESCGSAPPRCFHLTTDPIYSGFARLTAGQLTPYGLEFGRVVIEEPTPVNESWIIKELFEWAETNSER